MYAPPSTAPAPGSLYPRALRLQHSGSADGTLLATFEQSTTGTPVFPIYRSTDDGTTWTRISNVADTQNGWGMRWEPQLYELPTAIGAFPAGTLLIAGDSVPADRSATKIDLYASTDHGLTWTFASDIATGGQAFSSNGYTRSGSRSSWSPAPGRRRRRVLHRRRGRRPPMDERQRRRPALADRPDQLTAERL